MRLTTASAVFLTAISMLISTPANADAMPFDADIWAFELQSGPSEAIVYISMTSNYGEVQLTDVEPYADFNFLGNLFAFKGFSTLEFENGSTVYGTSIGFVPPGQPPHAFALNVVRITVTGGCFLDGDDFVSVKRGSLQFQPLLTSSGGTLTGVILTGANAC